MSPTTVVPERWETGSDFELTQDAGRAALPWDDHAHSLWATGRDAMRGLLEWGRAALGWRRLLMPSYFCQEVVGSTLRSIPIELYRWAPTEPPTVEVKASAGDVVFVAAMFGASPAVSVADDVPVIEDHSHDLLSPHAFESRADYAVASLRKTLPLPDGGVLWSPTGRQVPPAPPMTPDHAQAVLRRLSAMTLKQLYLLGAAVDKDRFRAIGIEGERDLSAGAISGISPFAQARLASLPINAWRTRRADNLAALRSALAGEERLRWLDVPFSGIVLLDGGHTRESVRRALIDERIYPSVLWPLEQPAVGGVPPEHVELSRRMLSIHVDQRYTGGDMERVAAVLLRALDGR